MIKIDDLYVFIKRFFYEDFETIEILDPKTNTHKKVSTLTVEEISNIKISRIEGIQYQEETKTFLIVLN